METPLPSTPPPPCCSPKSKMICLSASLVALIIVAIVSFLFGRASVGLTSLSQSLSTPVTILPTSTSTVAPNENAPLYLNTTPVPTVTVSKSVTIPLPSKWTKYQAQCHFLTDNIEIYYPNNWFPTEFNAVSDFYDPSAQACQVIFGYPLKPEGYQSYPKGQLATISVQTWIDKTGTPDERIKMIANQDPRARAISRISAGGASWLKMDYDLYETRLSTKINDRFIDILLTRKYRYGQYTNNEYSWITVANADLLNNDFLSKIRLLP